MICFDKVTEIYCLVDEFCINFEAQTSSFLIGNKPKRKPTLNTAEVITITLLFHLSGFRTFNLSSINKKLADLSFANNI